MRQPLSAHLGTLAVLGAYVVLSLVITWPLVLHYDRVVIGDISSDVWKHVWGFWWTYQCLVVKHVLPLHTTELNFPDGGALFFIDPLGGLLSTPLQTFMTAAEAYNTMVLFNIVLACFGAFLLARWFCKSAPAAFVAGVIYGCSPYLLSNITSGISESFNIGWIPIFMLTYTRAVREPRWSAAVKAGLALAAATLGCWYYGVFCGLYAVLFVLYEAVRGWRQWVVNGARRRGESLPPRPPVLSMLGAAIQRLRVVIAILLAFVFLRETQQMVGADVALPDLVQSLGIALAALMLLFVVLHRSRRNEDPPPALAILLMRFLAQALATCAAWLLLLLVRPWLNIGLLTEGIILPGQRLVVVEGLSRLHIDLQPLLLLGALSCLTLYGSLGLWRRCADPRLATRLDILRKTLGWIVLAGSAMLLSWFTLFVGITPQDTHLTTHLVETLFLQASHGAILGVGWLVLLWVIYRRLEAATFDVERLVADQFRRHIRPLLAAGLIAFVVAWWVGSGAEGWIALTALFFALYIVPPLALKAWGAAPATLDRLARRCDCVEQLEFVRVFCRTRVRQAVLTAFVAAIIVVPIAGSFKRTLNTEESLVFRQRDKSNVDLHLSEEFHNISRLMDYVTPGKAAAVRTYTVDRLTRVSYAGYLVLTLALVGALWGRRRDVAWWAMVAVGAVVLSMGPFLYVTPGIFLRFRFPPYMWLYDWFPFFSQVSIPFRFDTVAMLGFGVLSAYALARWMRGCSAPWRWWMASAVSLAVLLEVMFVSPAPFPVPEASVEVPQVIRDLASDVEPDCGLVDFPIQRFEGELLPGEYFFYQTLHRKAIPNRVEGEVPNYVNQEEALYQLFELEHDGVGYLNRSEAALQSSVDQLRERKLKYIVLHDNLFRQGAGARLHAMLRHFFGPPIAHDDSVTIYQVSR